MLMREFTWIPVVTELPKLSVPSKMKVKKQRSQKKKKDQAQLKGAKESLNTNVQLTNNLVRLRGSRWGTANIPEQ